MDAYIRVSRVGDRRTKGEAYRSPDIQRAAIEQWCKREGVELGKVVVEEDVSGGTAVKERGLDRLIKRCEAGASVGVVCYQVDRFGRDHIENIVGAKRLKDAGGRLVGVIDGVDTNQQGGKLLLNVLSMQAEDYLDRVKEGWDRATGAAVDAGIHIAARAPIGYLRRDQADPREDVKGNPIRDGRLVADPATADAVREAFRMRADGESYQRIADQLRETTGRGIVKSTVMSLLTNPAYLGEARGPRGRTNPGAHEALVDRDLWDRVQPRKRESLPPPGGSLARHALLGGFIRCDSCGNLLRVMRSGTADKRETSYVCATRFTSGDCGAPGSARVRLVDAYVTHALVLSAEEAEEGTATAERLYLEAKEDVRAAGESLTAWVTNLALEKSLGIEAHQAGAVARQHALDEAKRRLWDLDDPGIGDDQLVIWLDGKPMVYELWGENLDRDRRLLRRHIASVALAKADPKRRRHQPIEERVTIKWRGE